MRTKAVARPDHGPQQDQISRTAILVGMADIMCPSARRVRRVARWGDAVAEATFEEVPTYENYDDDFDGYSLGTEEELHGPAIAVAAAAPKLVAVVSHNRTGKVLVEVTKDLSISGTNTYTIELRTTPNVLTDVDGWWQRRKALVHAIAAVDRGTLISTDWDFCHLEIRNPNYAITPPSEKETKKTGRQATIGLPISEIGAGRSGAQLGLGELHQYLTLPWYRHEFEGNADLIAFSPAERIFFALMQSAALKLAQIVHTHGLRIATAAAKDAWEVRPRTPPAKLFDSSSGAVKYLALEVLREITVPPASRPGETAPSVENWALARDHIVDGKGLGGSYLPDCLVLDRPAALFEYRVPLRIPAAFNHAFWRKDESFL
jgi:hypothetical protein